MIGTNTGGTVALRYSVTWQPGKTILHDDGAPPSVNHVVTNESASFTGTHVFRVLVADPRFIDPYYPLGNFAPTAGSPLVDYADAGGVGPFATDLLNRPRNVDLGIVEDLHGPLDVGAYERQMLQPLVENGEFQSNVRVWTIFNGIVTNWDATQNAPGSTGGAIHIKQSTTSAHVIGAVQCIHLPGPGDYSLNGSGKVASGGSLPGDAHHAVLGWELRLMGSEDCTGSADASGDQYLAASGGGWQRPGTPAHIVVTPQQWTTDTSIAVYAVINVGPGNGGINGFFTPAGGPTLKEGWIDHVTLDIDNPDDDTIFKNGFEQP